MTKEVIVRIEGRLFSKEKEEEAVALTAEGTYYCRKGNHYVRYEERLPESGAIRNNTIKIEPGRVMLSKKDVRISHMVFDLQEITRADYPTPYGNLSFLIRTDTLLIKEEPEKIEVLMTYSLSDDTAHISDNTISITIRASGRE